MRYAKIEKNSVANGPGIRVVLWCQGCSIHCEGCHNESTWNFEGGKQFNTNAVKEIVEELEYDYVDGITLSGGHPLEPQSIQECLALVTYIRLRFPSKTIWLYTGLELSYEDIAQHQVYGGRTFEEQLSYLLSKCDVVVDGPYIESKRDLTLRYCGSSNQRVIDIKKTLENQMITLYEE